jgi:hypothetical protein
MIVMLSMQAAQWARRASRHLLRVGMPACAALLTNCLSIPYGLTQVIPLTQPEYTLEDPNSVDLLSATVYLHLNDVSIGSKEHRLTHNLYSGPDGEWTTDYPNFPLFLTSAQMDDFGYSFIDFPPCRVGLANPAVTVKVVLGHSSETFITNSVADQCLFFKPTPHVGPVGTPLYTTGSTLTLDSGSGQFTYTRRDGTKVLYSVLPKSGGPVATQMIYPDGRVLTYGYDSNAGLQSVSRSDGLQLKYSYGTGFNGFVHLTGVTAINTAYEYCDPTAATCVLKMQWPTATYSFTAAPSNGIIMTATNSSGATVYTMDSSGRTTGIRLPSNTSGDNFSYTYCDSNCPQYTSYPFTAHADTFVRSVLRDGYLWTYNGGPAIPLSTNAGLGMNTSATYGYTSPVSSSETVLTFVCEDGVGIFDGPSCGPVVLDPLIQLTDQQGDVFYGPSIATSKVTRPEGNITSYAWDSRLNLIQEILNPKSGSPLAQVTLNANYDATCTIPVKCNQPNWVQDGLGNQTDYAYDPVHGGVLKVTRPADVHGIRPETRYTYAQRYAWTLNSAGSYVKSAAPIWVLATESNCRTSAASPTGTGCTVAGDEVVETYEYGPDSGPNNLFLRGVAVTADGITHRTCYGYDQYGDKISETEPSAGLTSCP